MEDTIGGLLINLLRESILFLSYKVADFTNYADESGFTLLYLSFLGWVLYLTRLRDTSNGYFGDTFLGGVFGCSGRALIIIFKLSIALAVYNFLSEWLFGTPNIPIPSAPAPSTPTINT